MSDSSLKEGIKKKANSESFFPRSCKTTHSYVVWKQWRSVSTQRRSCRIDLYKHIHSGESWKSLCGNLNNLIYQLVEKKGGEGQINCVCVCLWSKSSETKLFNIHRNRRTTYKANCIDIRMIERSIFWKPGKINNDWIENLRKASVSWEWDFGFSERSKMLQIWLEQHTYLAKY